MAATVDEIESALTAPWRTLADGGTAEWTATPIAPWESEDPRTTVTFDNIAFDPSLLPANSAWMEVSASGGTRRKIGAGDVYAGYPTVLVSAHTPIGTGKQRARQLIDAAAALYRERIFTVGSSKLWAYSFSQPMELPKDGWFKLSMQISFRIQ